MQRRGIFEHDLLVVDRAVPAQSGNLIIAQLGSRFLVRQLFLEGTRTRLLSAHPSSPPIEVEQEPFFAVWGVVVYVLRATSPLSKQRLKETPLSPQDAKARHR
jgi:DNA polymerase V